MPMLLSSWKGREWEGGREEGGRERGGREGGGREGGREGFRFRGTFDKVPVVCVWLCHTSNHIVWTAVSQYIVAAHKYYITLYQRSMLKPYLEVVWL